MIPSTLNPVSPQAEQVFWMFLLLHTLMLFIFVVVFVVLLVAYFRFRARPGNEQGRRIYGNTPLELAWTAAPALLLASIFFLMLRLMAELVPPAEGNARASAAIGPVHVTATGYQFWWEFELPQFGILTANELHLPVGQRADFDLTAGDVIHSFWVPQLFGKRDMVPGQINVLSFVPTVVGAFTGICGEYCGLQHTGMRFLVFVDSEEDFQAWAMRQSQPAPQPQSPLAQRGQDLFLNTTCASCHAIAGTPANARAGPDLTHVASRTTIGAGVLAMTPENMALWLRAPQEVKPGNLMPNNPQLTEENLAALVAYMMDLQ